MSTRGFTLVEMIVALALFTFVMLIALSALLTLSNTAQKTQALRNVNDNLDFAVEAIARNLRVGSDYHCGSSGTLALPQDCAVTGQNFIAFFNSSGQEEIYRLNTVTNTIERSLDGGTTYLSLTAPEVKITTFLFYVTGTTAGDGLQPKVIMLVRGQAGAKLQNVSTFNIETTVTQRIIDS